MNEYIVQLDSAAAVFYRRVAAQMDLPVERVLADALFKLAGELSLEALHRKKQENPIDFPLEFGIMSKRTVQIAFLHAVSKSVIARPFVRMVVAI